MGVLLKCLCVFMWCSMFVEVCMCGCARGKGGSARESWGEGEGENSTTAIFNHRFPAHLIAVSDPLSQLI